MNSLFLHYTLEEIETPGLYSPFPEPFEVFSLILCHLPDEPVGDGFGEVVVIEGVYGLIVHEVESPARRIYELIVAPSPIRPFGLFEIYLNLIDLLVGEGGVVGVGVEGVSEFVVMKEFDLSPHFLFRLKSV